MHGSRTEICYFGKFEQASYDGRCPPTCPRTTVPGESPYCPAPGRQYKNSFDVMRRVAREVVIIISISILRLLEISAGLFTNSINEQRFPRAVYSVHAAYT